MATTKPIIPVVMCGGVGTRLWPVSRESMPKQFAPLLGRGSTFQQTLKRVADPSMFAPPIIITNVDFRFIVKEQLNELGIEADIALEPARRDSALAVAVAAVLSLKRDPAALVLVLAADHIVQNTKAFHEACSTAVKAANKGHIATFGITPSTASTKYGYIRPGDKIGDNTFLIDAFVEKPDAATAAQYVAQNYLWNSGNFIFRADVMLKEIDRFEAAIATAAQQAVTGITHDLGFLCLAANPFQEAPRKSIDYAVMEHTTLGAVVRADIGWSDLGTWDAMWEHLAHDRDGNAALGPAVLLGARNNLVYAEDSVLTAIVGMENLLVVTTGDAVLVTSRDNAEQVKNLVELLKVGKRQEAIEHRRIYRPWGQYQSVDTGARYQVKRITVKPGARLSLQKHFHRAEHWVVVKGAAEVTLDNQVSIVHENESIYVPIGTVHRLANPGKIPLELIEVQVGSYLGEDDIERIADEYGRG